MKRCIPTLILAAVASAVLGLPVLAASLPGDAVPPDLAEAALAYTSALVQGDLATSWNLLSSESRAEMDGAAWKMAFQRGPATRTPSGNALLRALAAADAPPSIGDVLVREEEALVEVSTTVQITQVIALVREGESWLVNLAATDQLNARAAVSVFLEAVAAEAGAGGGPRAARVPRSSPPMLQALLAAKAEDYHVTEGDIDGDRARVTLVCDLPVSLVLRAKRLGPGWSVDFSRPVLATDPTEPDPLRAALAEMDKLTCMEQLRLLGRAFTMYAEASDDVLPQAHEWIYKLQPFLPAGLSLHCPADPVEGVSYAFNENLAGKRRREVADPSNTPLVYESTPRAESAAGTGKGWPDPALHPGGNLVLYLDGSVRATQAEPSFSVRTAQMRGPSSARTRPTPGRLRTHAP
jgi:hypothetical protein